MTIKDEVRRVRLTIRDWVAIIGLLYTPLGWAGAKAIEINDRLVKVHAFIEHCDARLLKLERRLAAVEAAAKHPLDER